jgi:DNA repair exonuclease SbcCD ATPase subunit
VYVNSKLPKFSKSSRAALSASVFSILVIFLAAAFAAPARSQASPPETASVADAARNARERKANSTKHPKLITNADLEVPHPVPNATAFHLPSSSSNAVATPALPAAGSYDNSETQRLKGELQAAQQELARLRAELSYQPPVISDHDLDLEYFRPGNAGLNVGSPPLLESEPPAPQRVAQVELEERIAALRKALRIACEPPEAARVLIEIDDLEQQLNLLRRQFALDQDAYYSKTDFAKYTAEKAQLDAEQRQIQALQAHIEHLKQELAAMNLPQLWL